MRHRTEPRRVDRRTAFLAVFSVLILLSVSSHGQASDQKRAPRMIETCLDCHTEAYERLQGTPHQTGADDSHLQETRVTCTDCHAGDERHWQDDPEAYRMVDLTNAAVRVSVQVCAGCHVNSHQQSMLEGNAHGSSDVNCSGCHQIHGNVRLGLLKTEQPELCYECHSGVRGQFALPYRHPVERGIVKCSECHTTLDLRPAQRTTSGTDETCFSCHSEFRGPFPFEHQAAVDYSSEEGACLSCHEAHGSHLPRMLKQPYEAPHHQLCSQCHALPGHYRNSQHGTAWAGRDCNECHVDIHGSYFSEHLLSPSLATPGCLNPGCHK